MRLGIGCLCALAATGVLIPAGASIPTSGLYGVVTKGPITPVCRVGKPCDAPARVTLVFARPSAAPARARSSSQGRYRIRLAPGYYTVATLEPIGLGQNIRPRNVHVRGGHIDRLNFSIDTGIR